MMKTLRQFIKPDVWVIACLIVLWLLFFWRLWTPVQADQASLTQGDFSGQFVTFGAYQYERLTQGEIPLWNPYNNGGMPFIADTQAAVFYPPRLITIAMSHLLGTGWTYHALELEMVFHVLFYSIAMYAFLRRVTLHHQASVTASFSGALVAAYGGYMTGYPPLQLALLEAGVWFPLAALGILEATRHASKINWFWLIFTGWTLGVSWMAGHPQTSWFLTYFLIAYFAYRLYVNRGRIIHFLAGTAVFGIVSIGVVAVTLLPGIEYLTRTSRPDLGFDLKGGGFPYRDLIQIIAPGLLTPWSPLFIGVSGLTLASIALWKNLRESVFWLIVILVALALSFGAENIVFHSLYNSLPGLRYFRGQERAAYLIANCGAVLVALGTAHILIDANRQSLTMTIRKYLLGCAAVLILVAGLFLVGGLSTADVEQQPADIFVFSSLILVLLAGGLSIVSQNSGFRWLIPLIIVFELFSVNIDNSNFDPIPPAQQLAPPPFIDVLKSDENRPFRVDGLRGLTDNFGTYYGIADIQGISPLFLTGVQDIIEFGLPDERAWELFAVRYVYSEWDALVVPWEFIGTGEDRDGMINFFRLTAPRPYAHLVYDYVVVDNDEASRLLLADPDFDARNTVILHQEPEISLPETQPEEAGATIITYQPEYLSIIANSPENAILSLAHVDYPGWYAAIDGQETPILRAYGGLSAVELPAGEHTIELRFDPTSFSMGAIISLVTWGILVILATFTGWKLFMRRTNGE